MSRTVRSLMAGTIPSCDGLSGQILARPVGDVQPLGDGFQASQLNDLGPLEGGKSGPVARPVGAVPGDRASPSSHSDGRSSRWWMDRTGCGWPVVGSAPLQRRPGGSEPVGFDTRAVTDSWRSLGGSGHREGRSPGGALFGHAWGGSMAGKRDNSPSLPARPEYLFLYYFLSGSTSVVCTTDQKLVSIALVLQRDV